ncbi:MAG TPA: peptidoglycan-binding domain-containing protein [Pyrinomonadaceae bacterium]|jgi:peptidoglycan hydrolase-like protein with peptidoglycan-binding domain
MKRLLTAIFAASLCLSAGAAAAQTSNTTASNANTNANATKKRGPVFRATKEQIKQAQGVLKQRGFYAGDATGKLDTPTRDGLRKYQEAEGLKVTGTLNAATLQKMNVALTDKQKEWVAARIQTGQR